MGQLCVCLLVEEKASEHRKEPFPVKLGWSSLSSLLTVGQLLQEAAVFTCSKGKEPVGLDGREGKRPLGFVALLL